MVSNLGKTIERGFKTSEQRDIEQGIKKGKEKTAINLLKLGIAEEIIAKGTGLSLEKILELKKKCAN